MTSRLGEQRAEEARLTSLPLWIDRRARRSLDATPHKCKSVIGKVEWRGVGGSSISKWE